MTMLDLLNQRPIRVDEPLEALRFDYSQIEDATSRESLRQAAIAIKPRLKRAAEDLFAIGQTLMEVKELLPHGQWGEWLEAEFGLSDRTARNFMYVAERLFPKSEKFSVLPASVLYELAAPSTAETVIAQAEEKLDSGETVSLTTVRTWKRQQREAQSKRVTALRSEIEAWLATQALAPAQQVAWLKAMDTDVPDSQSAHDDSMEGLRDAPVEERQAAVRQLLADLNRAPAPVNPEQNRQALQTRLRQALALLGEEEQQTYADLTDNAPHLQEAYAALATALAALEHHFPS
jgi:hypothetical protein